MSHGTARRGGQHATLALRCRVTDVNPRVYTPSYDCLPSLSSTAVFCRLVFRSFVHNNNNNYYYYYCSPCRIRWSCCYWLSHGDRRIRLQSRQKLLKYTVQLSSLGIATFRGFYNNNNGLFDLAATAGLVTKRNNCFYPHMAIGRVWIYRLLFVCLFVCLYGSGFLHRG